MSSARKAKRMTAWFGYLAVDAAGKPCYGNRAVRVNPIPDWHLMPGQRSAYVAVVELRQPRKRRKRGKRKAAK